MKVNSLIEAIESGNVVCHQDMRPSLGLYSEKIKECVMFDGGEMEDLPLFSVALCTRDFIKLPFNKIMIEMRGHDDSDHASKGILWALCVQHGESIEIEFFLYSEKTFILTGHGAWLFSYPEKDDVKFFTLVNLSRMAAMTKSRQIWAGRVLQFLSALNCSNTFLQNNTPSEKIQKKRIKNGKLPFFEYKTLHIKISAVKNKTASGLGTHASPRVHLRRGHIRHLENKHVWVQPCVVGSKQSGIIYKDYALTE